MPPEEMIIAQSSVDPGDPHQCSDSVDKNSIINHLLEPLVERVENGYFRPCLAVEWGIKPDGLTWMFRLREGVFFHNGVRLRAKDIVDNLRRIISPSVGGTFGTEGVYTSYIGDAKFDAISDEVFTITTDETMPDLLDLLSEMLMGYGEELDKITKNYIGTGPYRLGSKKTTELELEAFNGYWGKNSPVSTLTWLSEPKKIRRAEMVLDRDADIGSLVGVEGRRLADRSEKAGSREFASWLCVIFMFNTFESPFRDRRLRQALNYALDMEKIIDEIKDGAADALNGFLTPHHYGHDPQTEPYPYDPDRSRSLLSKAGYDNGLKLTMDIPTSMPDEAPRLADIMKTYYSQVSVEVDVNSYYNRPEYAERVKEKRIHDLCCFDSSPKSTFRVLREKLISTFKGPWWQGYHNQEVNRLFFEATRTFNHEKRREIYQTIYTLITEDAPWVFMYRPHFHWVVGKKADFWSPDFDGLTKIK